MMVSTAPDHLQGATGILPAIPFRVSSGERGRCDIVPEASTPDRQRRMDGAGRCMTTAVTGLAILELSTTMLACGPPGAVPYWPVTKCGRSDWEGVAA